MRLLNTRTLRLKEFQGSDRPKYAILSHTWADQEVVFDDIQDPDSRSWQELRGASKVLGSSLLAAHDGYEWIWIDSCCINKSSSAELSEAINSMFSWYSDADVCYAYLVDVVDASTFDKSRWFTRGWTLQELIAPQRIVFYTHEWNLIGERFALAPEIARVTGIKESVLRQGHAPHPPDWAAHDSIARVGYTQEHCRACGGRLWYNILTVGLAHFSVAQRMRWAAPRQTTKPEDAAYSLLGLFGVNMPLLYGEGAGAAFARLQEEVLRRHNDQSILAFWEPGPLLASSARFFFEAQIHPSWAEPPTWRSIDDDDGGGDGQEDEEGLSFALSHRRPRIDLVNGELLMEMLVCPLYGVASFCATDHLGILDNAMDPDFLSRPAILLEKTSASRHQYLVSWPRALYRVDPSGRVTWVEGQMQASSEKEFDIDVGLVSCREVSIWTPDNERDYFLSQGPPLLMQPSVGSGPETYTVHDSYPPRAGERMIGHNPLSSEGVIVYSHAGTAAPVFCVAWTSGNVDSVDPRRPSYDSPIWCNVWSMQRLRMILRYAGDATALAHDMMREARRDGKASISELSLVSKSRRAVDGDVLDDGKRWVKASMGVESFLGKTILRMEIEINL